MVNLVVQSFGRENEYRRAVLTILSFYAHISIPKSDTCAILFTDRPDWFTPYLKDLPMKYILMTPEKIKVMRGKIDFLHRMKIALLEEAFEITEGNILYADSDTFFTHDPMPVMSKVSPTNSFMHTFEYKFEDMRNLPLPAGKMIRDFIFLLENNTFTLADGTPVKYSTENASWNAGVMMFHRSHKSVIQDAFALTDQFYPATGNHASEQFAFSLLLQTKTNLKACEKVIYHYWYRIKKTIMDEYLEAHFNDAWRSSSLESNLKEVKKWTMKLPQYLRRHYLIMADNAIQSFCEERMRDGYLWSAWAILKAPLKSGYLIKEVLYHTKRKLGSK